MWCAASAMGWTIWGLIPGSAQDFPRLQNVYSCSWAQPASYSVGTKSSCWRGNVCHELRTLPCRCCENKWTRYSHNIVTCPASAVSIASSVNYQLEGSTFNITSPGAQLCTLDETKKTKNTAARRAEIHKTSKDLYWLLARLALAMPTDRKCRWHRRLFLKRHTVVCSVQAVTDNVWTLQRLCSVFVFCQFCKSAIKTWTRKFRKPIARVFVLLANLS